MIRIPRVLLLLGALLFLSACLDPNRLLLVSPESGTVMETAVHATPEEALTAYVSALAASDAQAILALRSTDELSVGYAFDAAAARLGGSITPYLSIGPGALLPPRHPLYVEMNRAALVAEAMYDVKRLHYGLLIGLDIIDPGVAVLRLEEAEIAALMEALEPQRLTDLMLVRIALPDGKIMQSDRYREMMDQQTAVYGADELTERVALLAFEESEYIQGFTFGSVW
ncbi:MAG: hypothetical protein KDD92_05905 [Caldilineaceae bacterium]|nr:hypothetical protein [Caldilineaceae bacterium]